MKIPSTIRSGDTVTWRDGPVRDLLGATVTNATHSLTYYLRTNANAEGATVTGTADGTDWRFTVAANYDAGTWFYQAVATDLATGEAFTAGSGRVEVKPSLVYSGAPGAFDGRSQAEKDLEAVDAAIRTLMAGGAVQEYRIGARSLKRFELAELLVLRDRLKADVIREQRADKIANGLGDPHKIHIRFTG